MFKRLMVQRELTRKEEADIDVRKTAHVTETKRAQRDSVMLAADVTKRPHEYFAAPEHSDT